MYPPVTQFETLDAAARRRATQVREAELARGERSAPRRNPRGLRLKPALLRSLAVLR